MRQKKEVITYIVVVILLFIIYLLSRLSFIRYNLFSATFLSLVLEGLPFLLLGALLSSLIHLYVPDRFFTRLNKFGIFVGIFIALFLGLVIPLCECAIIPVAARMIRKGLAASVGISFMLAAPIINPLTLLSTYAAFSPSIDFVLLRSLGGAMIVLIIGLFMHFYLKDKVVLRSVTHAEELSCECHEEKSKSRLGVISTHTLNEFAGLALFFIMGAFIASLLKTYTPQDLILSIGTNMYFSIVAMMLLAFVLSICSQTDAFIAQTFFGYFSNASLLAFMIYGPMLDIKNTAVLFRHFEKKFVFILIFLITFLTFVLSAVLAYIGV